MPGLCSSQRHLPPGIGFDLTNSYATAAIRYYDGSMENLCKGGPIFFAEGYWDEIRCGVARAKRRWNKLCGRPSTPEVGTIAKLVKKLRTAVDEKLEHNRTKKALLTIPYLPGVSYEDLEDVMEYTGLTMLSTHKHIGDKISEVSAAFAGSGYGLCEHYDNIDACENEEADMPVSHILALSLSQTSFSAAYTYMQAAYRSILEKETPRFDLGLQNFPTNGKDSQGEEALYWSRMRVTIVEVGRTSREILTALLVLGENADNSSFVRTVQEALRELLPDASTQDISKMLLSWKWDGEAEPLYLAARGAAELAKRAQEAPAGCKEPVHCAENRAPAKIILSNQVSLSEGRQRVELEL